MSFYVCPECGRYYRIMPEDVMYVDGMDKCKIPRDLVKYGASPCPYCHNKKKLKVVENVRKNT